MGSIHFLDFERKLTNIEEPEIIIVDSGQKEDVISKYVSKKNFLSFIMTYTAPENILTADFKLGSKVSMQAYYVSVVQSEIMMV